jgi:hypothetical protein
VSLSEVLSILALAIAAVGGGSAFYAVVISRRAFAWQQQRDRERVQSDVRISFGHASNFSHAPEVIDLSNIQPRPLFYELTVSVVNYAETTEFIKTLWIESGENGLDVSPAEDAELRPRSRWAVKIDARSLPDGAGDKGFVAIAHLANTEAIVSDTEQLVAGMMDDIEQHNRAPG